MCGITGILSFKESITPQIIQKITNVIRHRGPDDEGIYLDGGIALGHRRLAIIDLSPDGHQPMVGPDGSTWLIFNGEIYNYLELRAELAAKGHSFKSNSDTEVILHAYQEYGCDCLTRFNGMFAFALWDADHRRLFLARDRLGVKPLYLYRDAHRLLFASEIKAILAALGTTPPPNQRLIYDFLTLGLLDHTDETFFEGIHKLPPAHYLLLDADGQAHLRRYWDFEVSSEVSALPDKVVADRCDQFFDLFTDAVRLRLISDVPVGSCLSGGLDSSAVVSIISQLIQQRQAVSVGPRQQTFSACYRNSAVDEQPYIDRVVQWTGALSHRVFPQPQDFQTELPDLIRHQEEPFASSSIYAQWTVMRMAREQGVTVLLDGQGADEQLLGYRKFYAFYIMSLLRQGRPMLGLTELVKHFGTWDVLKTLQLRRGLRYWQGAQLGSVSLAQHVLQPDFARQFSDSVVNMGIAGSLGERIKADITRFSLPVLLRYEDKNSMAFAREARVPFLDYRLVEFVAGLPLNLKLRNGWTKYCLRRGAQSRVAPEILKRKDKLGFATPEEDWFRQALAADVQQTYRQALFLPQFVRLLDLMSHFEAFRQGQRPLLASDFFFRFFILENWARSFIIS